MPTPPLRRGIVMRPPQVRYILTRAWKAASLKSGVENLKVLIGWGTIRVTSHRDAKLAPHWRGSVGEWERWARDPEVPSSSPAPSTVIRVSHSRSGYCRWQAFFLCHFEPNCVSVACLSISGWVHHRWWTQYFITPLWFRLRSPTGSSILRWPSELCCWSWSAVFSFRVFAGREYGRMQHWGVNPWTWHRVGSIDCVSKFPSWLREKCSLGDTRFAKMYSL